MIDPKSEEVKDRISRAQSRISDSIEYSNNQIDKFRDLWGYKWFRILLIIVCVLLLLFLSTCHHILSPKETSDIETQSETDYSRTETETIPIETTIAQVSVSLGSDEIIGKDVDDVVGILKSDGFNNITTREDASLLSEGTSSENTVSRVEISGKETFKSGDEFKKDVYIVINYLTVKRIKAPFDSSNLESMDYEDAVAQLKAAGFVNISTENLGDLIFGWLTTDKSVESISFDGKTDFTTSDSFTPDTKILVKYHSFSDNDTETSSFSVDDLSSSEKEKIVGTYVGNFGSVLVLYPSAKASYYFKSYLPDSDDPITLKTEDDWKYDSSTKSLKWLYDKGSTTVTADFSSDNNIFYFTSSGAWNDEYYTKISSEAPDLTAEYAASVLKKDYFLASKYMPGRNYKTVMQYLKDAGFKNITTTPIYDVILGITTPLGSIDKVTINGETNYDTYKNYGTDAKIDISYHYYIYSKPSDSNGTSGNSSSSSSNNSSKNDAVNSTTGASEVDPSQYEKFKRAVVVGLTNAQANDVWTNDQYDPKKFHSYADLSGFFLELYSDGTWNKVNDYTWHVDHILLSPYELSSIFDASCDVSFDGSKYCISNMSGYIRSGNITNEEAAAKGLGTNLAELQDSKDAVTYFIIDSSLVEEERDESKITEMKREKDKEEETAKKLFEIRIKRWTYPYDSKPKVHWFTETFSKYQDVDGIWYFEVGFDAKNKYGQKYHYVASGGVDLDKEKFVNFNVQMLED